MNADQLAEYRRYLALNPSNNMATDAKSGARKVARRVA